MVEQDLGPDADRVPVEAHAVQFGIPSQVAQRIMCRRLPRADSLGDEDMLAVPVEIFTTGHLGACWQQQCFP